MKSLEELFKITLKEFLELHQKLLEEFEEKIIKELLKKKIKPISRWHPWAISKVNHGIISWEVLEIISTENPPEIEDKGIGKNIE